LQKDIKQKNANLKIKISCSIPICFEKISFCSIPIFNAIAAVVADVVVDIDVVVVVGIIIIIIIDYHYPNEC